MGRDQLAATIQYAAVANKMPYAPTITTPYQLERKLGDLMAFYEKQKSKAGGNNVAFIT